MAIYHFEAQIISRADGRSSVAASAYRAAEKLIDRQTGLTHDFTHKKDVVKTETLLPEGAPERFKDRETLWNAVEAVERRQDAQLAREINISLPRELSEKDNWQLGRDFVEATFVRQGMIADIAYHRGHESQEDQPHLHVMLSLRSVDAEGFGKKERNWNDRALLCQWRERWAGFCNLALARAGLDKRVDHRTLEAQGLDLTPQKKRGPTAAGTRLARFEAHQAIQRANGEKLLKAPTVALQALTQQQATFTHQDIARVVNRYTVDDTQFQAVYAKVMSLPELISLGRDEQGKKRYTTQSMLDVERRMMHEVQALAARTNHRVASRVLNQPSVALSDEQHQAFLHVMTPQDLTCVTGLAGTGKSHLLRACRDAWEGSGFRVRGATLSGIAAENLEEASGIESSTVASLLWHWERERDTLTPQDILVVDEAGMLGSRQMQTLTETARNQGAKLVLVGDAEQLQAIEAGSAFRAIQAEVGGVMLEDVKRQRHDWQRAATQALGQQRTEAGLQAYVMHDCVKDFTHRRQAMAHLVHDWHARSGESGYDKTLMLAYTREDVATLNKLARLERQNHGELGQGTTIKTAQGTLEVARGERLYFLKNDRDLNIKNGSLGTVSQIRGRELQIRLDNGREVQVNTQTYAHLQHGYAATLYKAQGTTSEHSFVLASRYMDRHSTYVALSRHREGCALYYGRDEFQNEQQLRDSLSRARPKDSTLDYLDAPHHRGIEAQTLTPERRLAAQARLASRQYERLLAQERGQLEKQLGLPTSMAIEAGDSGIYQGSVTLAKRSFGVLQQAERVKLIPLEQVTSRVKGERMTIEHTPSGRQPLQAVQPSLERERGLSLGF